MQAPLTPLGVLCYDGCTITLDKQEMSVQKNVQEINKGTRKKKTGMWAVPLETKQSEDVTNNILEQTSKRELVQYIHVALLSPNTESLSKATKQRFLKTWPGITEKLIKSHLKK